MVCPIQTYNYKEHPLMSRHFTEPQRHGLLTIVLFRKATGQSQRQIIGLGPRTNKEYGIQ